MHILDVAKLFVDQSINMIDDPNYDWFLWYVDFDSTTGLFAPRSSKDSAIAYLQRTGEINRANELEKAIDILRSILIKSNYRIQKIDGIAQLTANITKVGMASELTVNMLETVNWEIRYICNTIFNACYDQHRQLEILPANLRRFASSLYFYDIHLSEAGSVNAETIQHLKYYRDKQYSSDPVLEKLEPVENMGRQFMAVHMPFCTIDATNYIPGLADNANFEASLHTIKLFVHWFYTDAWYPAVNSIVSADLPLHQNSPGFTDKKLSKLRAYAEAAVLGQMSALKVLATQYASNTITAGLRRTDIDDHIKNAYSLLTKSGFTQAALQSEIDMMLSNSNKQYVKEIKVSRPSNRFESMYKRKLL